MKALAGFLLLLAACSSSSSDASPPVLDHPDAAGSCTWPALFDSGAPGACRAAFYQLSCMSGTLTELCISNNPAQCPGPMGLAGCQNQCAADQYALSCDLNSGAVASAPGSCVGGGVTPGGTAYYCCPCGGG